MASKACIVLTTLNAENILRALVDRLLSEKLAACIQAMPIRSFYLWEGRRQEDEETLLLIKARRDDYERIATLIADAHDYKVPEILCLDVADAAPSYLGWLMDATSRGTETQKG